MNIHRLAILAAGALGTVIVAVAVWAYVLTGSDEEPSKTSPPRTPEAAAKVAARVVEATYSFDYKTAGPNTWLEQVKPDLTPDAYAFYRQTLGPGDGPVDTPFWENLVETKGHQRITAEGVVPDPASESTNTDTHLTLMVPFALDAAGIDSTLENGDRLFFVNLDRDSPAADWKVAAVLPTTGLLDDYATDAFSPSP